MVSTKLSIREEGRLREFIKEFQKRECVSFCSMGVANRCSCGRRKTEHRPSESERTGEWSIQTSTRAFPTDAYGMIEFQGDPQHSLKAHFIRLSFDTDPKLIMQLLEDVWGLDRPNMVISLDGGFDDFSLQPKLALAFQKGLIKAAATNGAWLITSGLNSGVAKYVSNALKSARKKKIVAIGIAPWGVLRNADDIAAAGLFSTINYHPRGYLTASGVYSSLNEMHSYFLLVDNGTFGRYGADIILRRRFEEYLIQQRMATDPRNVLPLVSVVLEGGHVALRKSLDCLMSEPPIPVVICEGSGGTADLLGAVNRHMTEAKDPFNPEFEKALKTNIRDFALDCTNKVYNILQICGIFHEYITPFHVGEDFTKDIDHSILTALLTRRGLNFSDRLRLASTWKRADIARSDLFVRGNEWTAAQLDDFMMQALLLDDVDFVDLLLQNGCTMEKFLTVKRLEELYNSTKGPSNNLLKFLVRRVVRRASQQITLADIGELVEDLIGGSYVSPYLEPEFESSNEKKNIAFVRPFNDLLIWAVLTVRQGMALCFWQRGEDALAKGLVATKLYRACAEEVAEFDTEQRIALSGYVREFDRLTTELLDQCYQTDDDRTLQLLAYELRGWPGQTCLGLAINAVNRPFLSHIGCQTLLTDLWYGGIRPRKNAMVSVPFCLLLPVLFAFGVIEFETKEELRYQAQGAAERNARRGTLAQAGGQPVAGGTPLTFFEKTWEFLAAPITKFWIWTISYLAFLAAFTYVAIVETTPVDVRSYWEVFIAVYSFTHGLEICRRVLISEERTCRLKLYQFLGDQWQFSSLLAVIILAIAFALRSSDFYDVVRVIYACSGAYWYIRLLELVQINTTLGPFLVIIWSMLKNTMYMVVLLLLILVPFGVFRQAILFHQLDTWDWNILKNVTYKSYFMWYGEPYVNEIDYCLEGYSCESGTWLATFGMATHIFTETSAVSVEVWKTGVYYRVMEYEQHSCLPPPLVIFYHLFALVRFFWRSCCGKHSIFKKKKSRLLSSSTDYVLKLALKSEDVENLVDFEEECMEELTLRKELTSYLSQNERLRRVTERQDFTIMKLEDALNIVDSTVGSMNRLRLTVNTLSRLIHSYSSGGRLPSIEEEISALLFQSIAPAMLGRKSAGGDSELSVATAETRVSYGRKDYATICDGIDISDCDNDDYYSEGGVEQS